jgi:hypothetical protein
MAPSGLVLQTVVNASPVRRVRRRSVATLAEWWRPAPPRPAALAIATLAEWWRPASPGPAALAIATLAEC